MTTDAIWESSDLCERLNRGVDKVCRGCTGDHNDGNRFYQFDFTAYLPEELEQSRRGLAISKWQRSGWELIDSGRSRARGR
jgi:hypothetical protein